MLLRRPRPRGLAYPIGHDRHQGARQPAHQAHAGIGAVPYEEAAERQGPRPGRVSLARALTCARPLLTLSWRYECSYVDSQLRKSKRFDAEGIERENPELFRPLPHRRYTRSSSSASLATDAGPLRTNGSTSAHSRGTLTPLTMTNLGDALVKRNNSIGGSSTPSSRRSQGNGQGQGRDQEAEEGQLRYWTNEMCRKSPHLFDFVITVSPGPEPLPSFDLSG